MPRSVVSRSLEPLISVLWGVFLAWSAWMAVVWIVPITGGELGFVIGEPPPPNEALRRAVLLLADYADIVWLALATVNLHLFLTSAHGLGTARKWFVISAAGALIAGYLNAGTGILFGKLGFGPALGARLFGVALGWVFLWPVLVISAREAVLFVRPRASHGEVALLAPLLVLLTAWNLEKPACALRGWWFRVVDGTATAPAAPWQNWLSWFAIAAVMAFLMREKSVIAGASRRSGKAALILAILNGIALSSRLRLS